MRRVVIVGDGPDALYLAERIAKDRTLVGAIVSKDSRRKHLFRTILPGSVLVKLPDFKVLKQHVVQFSPTHITFAGRLTRGILSPDQMARSYMNQIDPGVSSLLPPAIRTMIDPVILARAAVKMLEEIGIKIDPLLSLFPELSVSSSYRMGSCDESSVAEDIARGVKYLDAIPGQQSCVVTRPKPIHSRWGTRRTLEAFAKRRKEEQNGLLILRASPALGSLVTPVLKFETLGWAYDAGVSGILIEADKVAYVERPLCEEFCAQKGIFVLASKM